jgi:2-hydroxychromene-2-carboxylate isomerase
VIAAQMRGLDAFRLSHALLRALWAEERDTAKTEVRRAIADENGLPGAELVAAETGEPVQTLYRQYTEEAEKLGIFGAPTFVLAGERFWGQDRLDFLDRALDRLRARDTEGANAQ